MKRDLPDFFYVAPQHQEIHRRLENWAKSCFSGGGSSALPMFRLYRADNFERGAPAIPVDGRDAVLIAKGVAALPKAHRLAISWNYIEGGSPFAARKRLGVTLEGLMLLISDGRTMLVNRRV